MVSNPTEGHVMVYKLVPDNFHFDAPFVDVFEKFLEEDNDLKSKASYPVPQADITLMYNDDTGFTPSRLPLTLADGDSTPTQSSTSTRRLPSHFDVFNMGGWELNHMDVITAFLNGKLKGRIYMNNHLGLLYQTEVVAMRINSKKRVTEIKLQLGQKYKMKDLGFVTITSALTLCTQLTARSSYISTSTAWSFLRSAILSHKWSKPSPYQ
ncbi:hypothetical protein AXG93_4689s1610 [Marchantia polymorpha subsp. ruderalis]|uniref:Uncharacterized protein n=1 Tax=Marchantia polymorpha subsp. ruderalis TaxID=1480154 RepID=A0A176WLD5_MARPO|nr:hypothetical protein AXG93_4689s1610 [Marchantia polymorpha subsp. ruderalis]